jgi:N-acetylneuraminic acid mutarotase
MKKKFPSPSAFFSPRVLVAFLLCAAACSIVTGTLFGFLRPEAPANASQRTLTFAERVAYQRAIEDVYWRHRIWPKKRPDPKPSLDAVMTQAQLEKKVTDYLRRSQALEDYWQRPITAEQLQAEMDRMAKHTKQPEVLRELFIALGNDPFVIAECLARPALAERLLTSWYAHDQRIHGGLKQRAEAELLAHPSIKQMKQLSGTYTETELAKGDGAEAVRQAHRSSNEELASGAPALQRHDSDHSIKLNSREWDQRLQKLAQTFSDNAVAASVSPAKSISITKIPAGVLSLLQEDETHYYATAVIEKTDDHLGVATLSWNKEPLASWLARAESQPPNMLTPISGNYSLPKISDDAACIDDTWTATAGPPDARADHTAVWTGSEMIVWGGEVWTGYLNTGGRYLPSTDTWTATSDVNATTGRSGHTAVWTGSEMIVWGGQDDFFGPPLNGVNTGGRYNPATNSWTATSTTNAPTGRTGHVAMWTGSEMIVWGGESFNGIFNTGGRYNPATNNWAATSTTNAPDARAYHTAAWTGSEMIVWGGESFNGVIFNTGGRYNPATNNWAATSTTNAPVARAYHTAVWTGSEMVVWGGAGDAGYLNTGGRYNPGTNSWTATGTTNAPSGRYSHTAVWTGSEMIVWGGYDGTYANTGGKYNPGSDTWTATSISNAPSERELHTAVWTGNEMIIWGGYVYDGNNHYLNSGGRYNPGINSWTPTNTANTPSGRYRHAGVWTGSEMIVWGGLFRDGSAHYLNTGGKYDASTDSWSATSTTNAPSGREWHTAVWSGSEMIVWGGFAGGGTFLDTGGRYNPGTDSWSATTTTSVPTGRFFHTAVWTGSEMIIWGGYNYDGNDNFLNTGGRYNPDTNSWTATNTTNAPVGRESHTAVWSGTEMIVWGGDFFDTTTHYFNTGGRYNPVTDTWIATSTTNAPAARSVPSAVWTGNEMILWAGYGNSGYLNTGGRYSPDTNSWLPVTTANAPSRRAGHRAVWTDTEMIIWGGYFYDGDDHFFNTGGRYNPTTNSWVATSTVNVPGARTVHTAVWTGNDMLIWGGQIITGAATSTGGRYCIQSGPPPSPTPTPTPCTGRCSPTPRPRPSLTARPTPPPHLTPIPPPPSPRPTAWPRPTSPPHITPVPTPSSPRPTPWPRPSP